MGNKITQRKSVPISVIRILATICIVLCHYQQAYGSILSGVFNVGVQIFLVLSGFLFGHKDINDWRGFFKGRFMKLYFPMYIYTTLYLLIVLCYTDIDVHIVDFIKVDEASGLTHLWFMKVIAFCYIITPLLQKFRTYANFVFLMLCAIGLLEYLYLQVHLFWFSWIWLYSMGYFYVVLSFEIQKIVRGLLMIMVVFVTMNLSLNDILLFEGVQNRVWHDLIGLWTCFCVIPFLEFLNFRYIPKLFKWIDKYSFYIYISHHAYLIGVFSLVSMISNMGICIILTLSLIILTSYLLAKVADFNILFLSKITK